MEEEEERKRRVGRRNRRKVDRVIVDDGRWKSLGVG